jgi:hypothetical protein
MCLLCIDSRHRWYLQRYRRHLTFHQQPTFLIRSSLLVTFGYYLFGPFPVLSHCHQGTTTRAMFNLHMSHAYVTSRLPPISGYYLFGPFQFSHTSSGTTTSHASPSPLLTPSRSHSPPPTPPAPHSSRSPLPPDSRLLQFRSLASSLTPVVSITTRAMFNLHVSHVYHCSE